MLASTNRESVTRFLREHQLAERAGYFPFERDGTSWYAVVYGTNPSYGQAANAATALPDDLRIRQPWVRRLDGVQKQIDDRATKEKIPVQRARTELLAEKQPSLEFATPEQIGAAAVFLCSEAAAQIRGVALPVDGGWTAQ